MQQRLAATSAVDQQVLHVLRDVITACDADRLARVLGLRSGQAADNLRANTASLNHLATRLTEGCGDATPDEARAMALALLRDDATGAADA